MKLIFLHLLNSFGACRLEFLIEILLVYQIPLRDIVSKVVSVILMLFEYHKGYLYLKIAAFISKSLVSFKGDSPSRK